MEIVKVINFIDLETHVTQVFTKYTAAHVIQPANKKYATSTTYRKFRYFYKKIGRKDPHPSIPVILSSHPPPFTHNHHHHHHNL
jgi:hypothetical protein